MATREDNRRGARGEEIEDFVVVGAPEAGAVARTSNARRAHRSVFIG